MAPMRSITVLVSAAGAPGTAALLRGLRENGEREVRLVGTDMSERSVGRHLCDAFHLVPAGADPAFADALNGRGVAWRVKGDRRRALADFDAAIRLRPDFEAARANRKSLFQEIERLGAQMPLKGKGN